MDRTWYCVKLMLFSKLDTLDRDNPKSDVRGARSQLNTKAILVRTGVFNGSTNDPIDPADYVVEDVLEAVNLVAELEEVNLC